MSDRPGSAIAPDSRPNGLECPRCGCFHFEVTHTYRQHRRIRRRRVCRHCGRAVYTFEVTSADLPRRRS